MANSFKIPFDNAPEMIDATEAERIARENGGSALVNSGSGAARFFVVMPDRFREMEAVNRLAGHSSPMPAKKETRKQRKMRAAARKRDEERKARELKARRRRQQERAVAAKKRGLSVVFDPHIPRGTVLFK